MFQNHLWSTCTHACLTYSCCPAADLSKDVGLFRSLVRAAISSSADATNPEHLPASRQLLLSLSPHVVVPDALEKEQQHAAAVRLQQQQQQHAAAAQHRHSPRQQQEQEVESLLDAEEAAEQSEDANGHPASQLLSLQDAVLPPLAVGAAVSRDHLEDIPGTPGSPASPSAADQQQQGQLYEPEFTDPLRRRTYADDSDDPLSGDEADADLDQSCQGLDASPQVAPLWLQGLQAYDRWGWAGLLCSFPRPVSYELAQWLAVHILSMW